MARASTPTLLSLDRYARILGIAPPHFNQSAGTTTFPVTGSCDSVWPQWSWQHADQVSREDLARVIYDAEEDIARELGYYPAPNWIAQELLDFPRHHRRDVWQSGGLNVRGARKSLRTRFGKFIQAGQRLVAELTNSPATTAGLTLAYDLAALTATITIATTLTDVCEVKAYFANENGAPEWEIRPAKSKSISAGVLTMVFDAWMLIDPDLWEAYPTTAGFSAVDLSVIGNYVTSVELWRETNDFTATSVTFFWEPTPRNLTALTTCTSCGGTGCVACSLTSQNGCLHVRNTEVGDVVPVPATYDADEAQWTQDVYTVCRDPDEVRLYYYAGDYSNRWRAGDVCDPLSDYWAHTIAWLATARLERDFCSCGNVQALADHWREDLAETTGERSFIVDLGILTNPFGTKRGEMMAWQRIDKIQGRQLKGGAI